MRNYYDLHVTSNHSFGTNTIEEMVKMAEKLELHTIVIADAIETQKELDQIKSEIAALKNKTPVQILLGIEIRAEDANDLNSKINKWRSLVDVLVVSGGNIEVNRAACENPKVNLLAHPEFKRMDSGLDDVMVQAAAKNGVAIELNFREYLHTYKKLRSHILSHMQTNVMLARHFGSPVVVTSAAESIWDLRAGRELSTLAFMVGMDREQAVDAVSTIPEQIVLRIKRITAPGFVMPGVQVKTEAPAEKEKEDIEEEEENED